MPHGPQKSRTRTSARHTSCTAPVGPEMRVARVENSPEPAGHGLHLGAALAAATRRRPAFARLLPFALYQTESKTKQKRMRGAASNRRHSRRHSYGRVEPGTRTAPILGHRVVHVRWYPARFLKFCRRHGGASSACDRTDPTERSRSRPGRRRGRRHAAPRNLGRAGRAFVGPPNRSASIEPV